MTAPAPFELLQPIREVEVIAIVKSISDLPRLRKTYSRGRKLKGTADVRLFDDSTGRAELH